MANRANLNDFEEVVRHISAQAKEELGRKSAAITADAAAKGALSNNRIVFLYADALEEAWTSAADRTVSELRRWVSSSKVGRGPLRDLAERELRQLIPTLVDASRVKRAAGQFSNQTMLASAKERVDALEDDLAYRLRQFDINMDSAAAATGANRLKWLGEHMTQIAIAVVAAAIIAYLGLA